MKEEKNSTKYPKVIVGAFIFNEKNELFLMKSPKWKNKYVCPGGKIETEEKAEDALKREIKEETNLNLENIEFFGVLDGLGLEKIYTKEDDHFVFLNYRAEVKGDLNIILNEEGTKYKWLSLDEWKKNEKKIAFYTFESFKKLEKNSEDFEEKYKRALADYQNLLKRTASEKNDFVKYANEQLFLEILPVYDNLKESLKYTDNVKSQWIEGIKYVVKQFKTALENSGIEEIKTKEEKFDHNTMEAVEGTGEKIKKEVRSGYKLNGRVIIPARVIVE